MRLEEDDDTPVMRYTKQGVPWPFRNCSLFVMNFGLVDLVMKDHKIAINHDYGLKEMANYHPSTPP